MPNVPWHGDAIGYRRLHETGRVSRIAPVQAGMALESIRLGEKIAERIEEQRRVTQEMEYAKQSRPDFSRKS